MLRPGIDVVEVQGGYPARVGVDWAAIAEAAKPYIKKAIAAISDWFAGTTYDAFGDFTKAVAISDALIPAEAAGAMTTEERIGASLAAGVTPIYCSDSEGARNRIWQEFKNRGWEGERWGGRYASGGGSYKWYFGVIMHLRGGAQGGSDCPPDILAAAKTAAAADYTTALARTLNLCRDAKGQFKQYNKVSDPDFDTLIKVAVPVFPTATPPPAPQPTPPPTPPRQTPPIRPAPRTPVRTGPAPTPPAPVDVIDRVTPEGQRRRGVDAKDTIDAIRSVLGLSVGADILSTADIAAQFKRQTLDRLATIVELLRDAEAHPTMEIPGLTERTVPPDAIREWLAAIEVAMVDIQIESDPRNIADSVYALARQMADILRRAIQRRRG